MDPDVDPGDGLPSRTALARELLLYKMKEYSQDGFCASWLVDLEFELWESANLSAPSPQEMHSVSTSRECRALAQIADGWWVYEDETRRGENGPVFISTERWMKILSKHDKNRRP